MCACCYIAVESGRKPSFTRIPCRVPAPPLRPARVSARPRLLATSRRAGRGPRGGTRIERSTIQPQIVGWHDGASMRDDSRPALEGVSGAATRGSGHFPVSNISRPIRRAVVPASGPVTLRTYGHSGAETAVGGNEVEIAEDAIVAGQPGLAAEPPITTSTKPTGCNAVRGRHDLRTAPRITHPDGCLSLELGRELSVALTCPSG